jgi:hypothetical protein
MTSNWNHVASWEATTVNNWYPIWKRRTYPCQRQQECVCAGGGVRGTGWGVGGGGHTIGTRLKKNTTCATLNREERSAILELRTPSQILSSALQCKGIETYQCFSHHCIHTFSISSSCIPFFICVAPSKWYTKGNNTDLAVLSRSTSAKRSKLQTNLPSSFLRSTQVHLQMLSIYS